MFGLSVIKVGHSRIWVQCILMRMNIYQNEPNALNEGQNFTLISSFLKVLALNLTSTVNTKIAHVLNFEDEYFKDLGNQRRQIFQHIMFLAIYKRYSIEK